MVTLVAILMVAVALVIVMYPLWARRGGWAMPRWRPQDERIEQLLSQREAAYAAIKDLEFDHAMGKLSDADYQAMRAKYEAKAVAVLQELDKYGGRVPAGDAIEEQVRALRAQRRKERGAPASAKCPACSAPYQAGDQFCAKCGATLLVCSSCGAPYREGDRFCARCGSKLVVSARVGVGGQSGGPDTLV